MQPTKRSIAFIQLFILIAGLVVLTSGTMAQVAASAKIQATIISPAQMTEMSLSSADGNEFMLQNDMNRCFDVTLDGMPSTLTGGNSEQQTNHELCLDQQQTVASGVSKTRLNVLFSGLTKEDKGSANIPYSISVHYN